MHIGQIGVYEEDCNPTEWLVIEEELSENGEVAYGQVYSTHRNKESAVTEAKTIAKELKMPFHEHQT